MTPEQSLRLQERTDNGIMRTMSDPRHDDVELDQGDPRRAGTSEPSIVLFIRKLLDPLRFGRPETPVTDQEFKQNEALEETAEEELRDLEREREAARLAQHQKEGNSRGL